MKRSVSTLFVILILMNVMGYYALLVGLQYRNALSLSEKFDQGGYAESETGSIKIYQPGLPGSDQYSRIDGEFEKDGQVFRLIKQRHYQDTFHIVFIKDERGTLIKHALSDYARAFSEKTQDDDSKLIVLPVFIREYLVAREQSITHFIGVLQIFGTRAASVFIDTYAPKVTQPPRLC
jgi:hypothetical protein